MPELPEVLPSDNEDEREGGASSSSGDGEEGSSSTTSRTRTGPRPPSYASEDGVSYVVEARPRSTINALAPQPQIVPMPSPLPVHPSEMGRIATPPSR